MLQDAPAKLCSSFVVANWNNAGPFVQRFYHPDKTFNPIVEFKNGFKDEQSCQAAAQCIKIVSSYRLLYLLFSDP